MTERGIVSARRTAEELATLGAILELDDGSLVYNMGDGILAFDQIDDTLPVTSNQRTIRAVISTDDAKRMAALNC